MTPDREQIRNPYEKVTDTRDQTVGSMYLGFCVELKDVDWGLDDERQERIAEACKQAEEAAKRVIGSHGRIRVEFG